MTECGRFDCGRALLHPLPRRRTAPVITSGGWGLIANHLSRIRKVLVGEIGNGPHSQLGTSNSRSAPWNVSGAAIQTLYTLQSVTDPALTDFT
ncbi:hypothetical protein J6590_058760 [Homalodisca vitripennis]|nr:hypothetical protein J6590_058760 [Homalodisca vitripennis]